MSASRPERTDAAIARRRILLVDDHEVVRRGIASLFNTEPDLVVCGEADSMDSALTAIERTNPDLVLLDMSLRDDDGLEVLHRIRAQHPKVLVLVLSMYEESVYAERAIRAGARGYVRKLDAAQTIVAAIRKVIAGQIHASDAVANNLLHRLSGGNSAPGTPTADRLSDRELQVLRCIGRGMSNREIAGQLFISTKTVESHRDHIKTKLGLASSGDLLRYAIEFCRVG